MSETTLMTEPSANLRQWQIAVLLGGRPDSLKAWVARWETRRVTNFLAIILAGAGLYGAAMGYWRSPVQAAYNLVKFPLVLLATALGNALINGMLAPLLGLNLRLQQSLLLVLMSFTIAAAILGSFAPLVFFIIWNTPSLELRAGISWASYNFVQLTQVALIAFAGVAANLRLLGLLRALSGSRRVARNVLCAWLAGNLFLGSQLCWILRPFIGSPYLPVEFVRPNAFQGNFYEAVAGAIGHFLSS